VRAIRIVEANWLNDEIGGDKNTVKSVSDDMAREAVEVWHIAEYAPEYENHSWSAGAVQQPAAEPVPPAVTEFPVQEPSPEFREQAAEFMDANDELLARLDDEPVPLRMPWSNASKADWIRWAAHGDHGQPRIDEGAAAALTRNELMSRYGERL
jgi:hypothetical protein